jgi:tRNA (guanine37-N1)-methyltransferase
MVVLADTQRASRYLGHPVTPNMTGYDLHLVRRVAPNKDMYCLTFQLPKDVAFAPNSSA